MQSTTIFSNTRKFSIQKQVSIVKQYKGHLSVIQIAPQNIVGMFTGTTMMHLSLMERTNRKDKIGMRSNNGILAAIIGKRRRSKSNNRGIENCCLQA